MAEEFKEIPYKDIRIEKINEHQLSIIKDFKTSNQELKDFLVEDALTNEEMGISSTYLWFYNPKNKLIAYVTILTDAIRIHGTNLGKWFLDQGVEYKTLPAIKIGRICVDEDYKRKGIGTKITYFVMKKLIRVNREAGCRFLIVDAKKEAIKFYKRMNFSVLKEREKGTLPMYYDMIKIIKYFKEHKIKLSEFREENTL